MSEILEVIFDEAQHTYTQSGRAYPSVTQLLQRYNLAADFSGIPARVLDFAAARGNAVHEAGRLLALGQLDESTIDPRIAEYVNALKSFLKDSGLSIIDVETPRISPLKFGFTIDLVAFLNGRRAVLDYKTGQNMPKSTGVQLAAYRIGWNSLYADQPIEDRFGVHLRDDGTYRLKQYEDPDDETAFLDCLDTDLKMERWIKKYGGKP